MLERIVKWLEDGEAAAALRRLDDHLLADMGLVREEIDRQVRGAEAEEARPCGRPLSREA